MTKSIVILAILLTMAYSYSCGMWTGDAYQQQSASAKADTLMKEVKADQTTYGWYSTVHMAELFVEDMNTSFDPNADGMPCQGLANLETRPKLIHSVGLVAEAKWVSTGNHPYTGVFKGCDNVLIRLSSAKQADNSVPIVTPGIGVKFLRDNVPSFSFVSMYSLEGQESYNFFEHDFTNHVPDLDPSTVDESLKLLKQAFLKASKWPTMVGLSNGADYTCDGAKEADVQFPFRLILHPSSEAHTAFPSTPVSGDSYYLDQIKGKKFDTLYHVYAQASPDQPVSDFTEIGQIQMTSDFYESYVGDVYLFMQHQRFEDDLKIMPNWVEGAQKIIDEQEATPHYKFPDLPWN